MWVEASPLALTNQNQIFDVSICVEFLAIAGNLLPIGVGKVFGAAIHVGVKIGPSPGFAEDNVLFFSMGHSSLESIGNRRNRFHPFWGS